MKRFLLPIGFALLALLSCQRQEMDVLSDKSAKQEVILTAELRGVEATKTQLGADSHIYWSPGDAISVFSAGEHAKFVAQNTEPEMIAKFKGEVSVVTGASDGDAKDYIWGAYPYHEDNGLTVSGSEPLVIMNLPPEQVAKAGTFNDGYAIAIGKSETLGLSFNNLYSGFWFTLSRSDILSVTLSADRPLAGYFAAGYRDGEAPRIAAYVEDMTSDSITLTAPEGGAFEVGKAYYFITLPGSYSELTFTVRTANMVGSRTVYNQELKRNDLSVGSKNLDKKIETNGTGFQSILPPDNEIWIETIDGEFSEPTTTLPYTWQKREDGKIALVFEQALTEIPSKFYYQNYKITEVYLPESVTNIGWAAFMYAENLQKVVMGNSVKTLQRDCFAVCSSLGSIDLPRSLETIFDGAFRYSGLRSVRIPDSVITIWERPFEYCRQLSHFYGKFASADGCSLVDDDGCLLAFAPAGVIGYTIPDGVKTIGPESFAGSMELTILTFNDQLEHIDWRAFENCPSLTSVDLPASVVQIGASAFLGCTALQSITLRSESLITGDDTGQFDGTDCDIFVPGNLLEAYRTTAPWSDYASRYKSMQPDTEIWYTTTDGEIVNFDPMNQSTVSFENDTYGVIRFAEPLTTVEQGAFFDARNLLSVTLPSSVKTIKPNAFASCISLQEVTLPEGLETIEQNAFTACPFSRIDLPSSLKNLGPFAFYYCENLESVTIPDSVEKLGYPYFYYANPFEGCTSLHSFYGKFATDDHRCLLYGNPSTEDMDPRNVLVSFAPGGMKNKAYRIPDGVLVIARDAFTEAPLSTVDLNEVFMLWNGAFSDCLNLRSISIPAGFSMIGDQAFYGCTLLKSITLNDVTPPSLGAQVFQGIPGECVIRIPAAGYENYVEADGWKDLQSYFVTY